MFDIICRFCGKEDPNKFSCIFDGDPDENGITLLQKIGCFIPITISEGDGLPNKLCANCVNETNHAYDFIQSVLKTQSTFCKDQAEQDRTKSFDGGRTTRATARRKEVCERDPFELVTVIEKRGKQSYARTAELEIDLIPTETKVARDKRLNSDVCDALTKLKSVARNLTVSRTAAKKVEEPMIIPDTIFTSRELKQAMSDFEEDNDNDYFEDESKSVSSFSSQSEDEDDEDEYVPQTKKRKKESSTSKVAASGSSSNNSSRKDDKFTVYKINTPPVFLCLKCDTRFATFVDLKSHISGDNDCKRASLTCEICNRLCKNRKSLHSHMKGHEQKSSFVCDQCGKIYTNQFNLENHKSAQHGEYVQEHGHTYRCQMCEARFDNRTDLYAHIANHEKIPVTVVCDKCGKSFKSNKALHTHLRQHLDIRPYACEFCEKRFGKRLTLTQHLHVHTGIKTFKCDECEKSFAKRDSLIVHKRKHTGETPYECIHCSQKYTSLNQLKTHLKSHPANNHDHDRDASTADHNP